MAGECADTGRNWIRGPCKAFLLSRPVVIQYRSVCMTGCNLAGVYVRGFSLAIVVGVSVGTARVGSSWGREVL